MSNNRQKTQKERLLILLLAIGVAAILHFFPQIKDFFAGLVHEYNPPRTVTEVSGELAVRFIDVGQGDASLIVTPDGTAMLIDAGIREKQEELVSYLNACKITVLDYFVLTHPHADHIGGAEAIFDEFEVKNVLLPDAVTDTAVYERVLRKIDSEGAAVHVAEPGKIYELSDARFTLLGPVESYDDLNNMSVVLRLDYGSTSFLFTGDAESKSEADMLKAFPESAFSADVLKLGHHGSSTSTSEEWLSAVHPSYAVACCGKDNDYGHPHRETVEKLARLGIPLLRTDLSGDIVFSSDGKTVTLRSPGPEESSPTP